MLDIVKIPGERKPVVIGRNGATKKRIEKLTKTSLRIGEGVQIEGEPLDVLTASKIIKAIGRGFSPKNALLLLDEEMDLHIIKIQGTDKRRHTKLSRLIGRQGSAKKMLQTYTGAKIAIQGKTVSFIGTYRELKNAAKAVDDLLSGRKHGTVYKHARRRSRR